MKAKFNYTVRSTLAPGETKPTLVPVVTSRFQPVDLATVLENCIDRGLIAGLKSTAAQGIADGIAEQIAHEFTLGRGVKFGEYFYGRPYLTGQVDANGVLTSANKVKVNLYKGPSFKLAISDFTFTFDGSGDAVKVESIYGKTAAANGGSIYGQIVANSPVVINGKNLFAVGDTVKVVFEAGETKVEVTDFSFASGDQLVFAWPATLTGTEYSVTVSRTDANDQTRSSSPKTVSVFRIPETMRLTNIVDSEQGAGVVDTVTKGMRFNMHGENLGTYSWDAGTGRLMDATLTISYIDSNDQAKTKDITTDAMKTATEAGDGYLAISPGESGWQNEVKAGTRPTLTFVHLIDGVSHSASRSFALVG